MMFLVVISKEGRGTCSADELDIKFRPSDPDLPEAALSLFSYATEESLEVSLLLVPVVFLCTAVAGDFTTVTILSLAEWIKPSGLTEYGLMTLSLALRSWLLLL